MTITKVKVKPVQKHNYDTLDVEETNGLEWAVVYNNGTTIEVIALFGSKFWAQSFIETYNPENDDHFELREVYDNDE